jgi:hypothetical protein
MKKPPVERRSSELIMKLPEDYQRPERRTDPGAPAATMLDAATGLYTMAALTEFIQYEIDGSAQTLLNELYVTPLCVIAVEVAEGGGGAALRRKAAEVLREAGRRATRAADRVARDGERLVVLLRRTLAANVRDHYAARLTSHVEEQAQSAGVKVGVVAGISSLVEHVARGPDDLVRKAMRALEVARAGPEAVVIYDFRTMPLG